MIPAERLEFTEAAVKLVGDKWTADPDVPRRGTVLLLHGGGQTRHSWRITGAKQAETGWDAIALDARGHGDSGWSPDGDYAMDALVADLRTFVATLPEPPVIIGASMGGMTAIVAEGEGPGLASGLVLVDVTPRLNRIGTGKIRDFMVGPADGFASLDEVADAIAAYNPFRQRPKNLAGLQKNVRQHENGRWYWHWDPAFVRRIQDEPARAESENRLLAAAAKIRIPTLLVRGAHSDVVTPEAAAEFLELVPGSEMVEVTAGHMVAGDDNDVFTGHVNQFLNRRIPIHS